jgi:hypothetical protein
MRQCAMAACLVLGAASAVFADSGAAICTGGRAEVAVPRSYVAVRRLEAFNRKSRSSAWMEARTTLADGRLDVEIVDEGGSEYIREKVFRRLLRTEQELTAGKGPGAAFGLSAASCGEPEATSPGLIRVPLNLGASAPLADAQLFVRERDGNPTRLVGRLRKNPSFWVSRVDLEWSYAPMRGGVIVPVEFRSTARVKMYGESSLRMQYDFESVNGRPVSTRAAGH